MIVEWKKYSEDNQRAVYPKNSMWIYPINISARKTPAFDLYMSLKNDKIEFKFTLEGRFDTEKEAKDACQHFYDQIKHLLDQ